MENSYKIAKQYLLIVTDDAGNFNMQQFSTQEDAQKEMQRQFDDIYRIAQQNFEIIDYSGIIIEDKATFKKIDMYETKYRYDWHIVEVKMNVPIFDCE